MFFLCKYVPLVFLFSTIKVCRGIADIGFELSVESSFVLREAEYALRELSLLSDSLIYETLKLHKILAAREHDGIFHRNILLELELSSPHFKSGMLTENFNLILMEHKDDGTRSIAIDEFPLMNENDLEQFYEKKIRAKRVNREELFRRMEVEAQIQGVHPAAAEDDQIADDIEELLLTTDTELLRVERMTDSAQNLQPRLVGRHLDEERHVSSLSLLQLREVVAGTRPASAYQKYRAEHMLEAAVGRRSRR